MARGVVVMSHWATHRLALIEALRLNEVTREKFTEPIIYTVRKRRTHRYDHAKRLWNYGHHDLWLVLTGPEIPDRDTSNPTRPRTETR